MFKIFFNSLVLLFIFFATNVNGAELPILWGHNTSPFVRKVILALEYKKLPYENIQETSA